MKSSRKSWIVGPEGGDLRVDGGVISRARRKTFFSQRRRERKGRQGLFHFFILAIFASLRDICVFEIVGLAGCLAEGGDLRLGGGVISRARRKTFSRKDAESAKEDRGVVWERLEEGWWG